MICEICGEADADYHPQPHGGRGVIKPYEDIFVPADLRVAVDGDDALSDLIRGFNTGDDATFYSGLRDVIARLA